MAFFFSELGAQVDWSARPRFLDKELAGIGFGGAPDGMVADKLVEVCLRNGSVQWVLIHIEVQAQRDTSLASHAFHNQLLGTVMGISFATAKLLDFAAQADALMASHNPFALVTLAHLRTQQAGHDPDRLYAARWQLTKLLYEHGWSKRRIIVLFKVINWMMNLPPLQHERYWRGVLRLGNEHNMELDMKHPMEWVMPLEQMFIDKGLRKGLEQGLERGRREGAAALLERLLTRRFGPLPQTARSKLGKASEAQLAAWSDALQEAQSLQQIFEFARREQ